MQQVLAIGMGVSVQAAQKIVFSDATLTLSNPSDDITTL